jgi:dCMP deaminase
MKYLNDKWKTRYIQMAGLVASWSKDPSTQVGSVIVGEHGQILSQGFNGLPRNIDDATERYANKELKYSLIVHSELNCILNAGLTGTKLEGSTMFVYGLPVCNECAKAIIQSGIKRVYWHPTKEISEIWKDKALITSIMFEEAGVLYERVGLA